MEIVSVKSKIVCHSSEIFLLMAGHKHFNLGLQIHNWGIRFMLIWFHVCIRFKD